MSDLEAKFEKQNFDTDLGQRANVARTDVSADFVPVANKMLTEIGVKLQQCDEGAKALEYVGSAAVHIYQSNGIIAKDGTPQLIFASQTDTLGRTHELAAGAAGQDLLKAIARRFGRKPPTKRSGF